MANESMETSALTRMTGVESTTTAAAVTDQAPEV